MLLLWRNCESGLGELVKIKQVGMDLVADFFGLIGRNIADLLDISADLNY